MPFLFLIAGAVMMIAAVRGTHQELATLLHNDFTGKGNFIYWTFAILVLGALGYIKTIQPATRMFMALVVIALFISNKGVFAQLQQALKTTETAQPTSTGLSGLGTTNAQAA